VSGAAGYGPGITIKHRRGAAGNGLDTTIKYLRGAASFGSAAWAPRLRTIGVP
jgi:hypothetical protein